MNEGSTWRLVSDYIGAGDFVLSATRAFVGTEYGVQCVPYSHDSLKDWKTDLGSRAISVRAHGKREILATCLGGVFLLTREGDVAEEILSADEIVHPVLPIAATGHERQDGDSGGDLLVSTQTCLQRRTAWRELVWELDYHSVLGQGVKSVRLVNLFELKDHFVAGVVDYESGIGRVVVLDASGAVTWMSPVGPISELFPAGEAVFVWCQTSYGKFETRLTRLDGREIWRQDDMAGVGRVLPDGSIVMLVGSNESPKWDNWEFRLIAANGKISKRLAGRGRCPVRPLCLDDGGLVFIGAASHLDPSSSRVDYTNFLKMPQEALFQHLVGLREQTPEYEVYLHRLHPRNSSLEIVYHASGSYSLAEPVSHGRHVVFCDGKDIIGIES
jgi:hypothetical protein